eukprot:scaffold155829_cov52-Prasinocladus_malaysianus.AAC.1
MSPTCRGMASATAAASDWALINPSSWSIALVAISWHLTEGAPKTSTNNATFTTRPNIPPAVRVAGANLRPSPQTERPGHPIKVSDNRLKICLSLLLNPVGLSVKFFVDL